MLNDTNKLDLTDLQEEVMAHWEDNGRRYLVWVGVEGQLGGGESDMMDWAEKILDDPQAMIEELGFEKYSDYVRERTI